MGGHPYWYYVPYQDDTQASLDDLRTREFEAGRYSPVIRYLKYDEGVPKETCFAGYSYD
jgi:hypothetical protein